MKFAIAAKMSRARAQRSELPHSGSIAPEFRRGRCRDARNDRTFDESARPARCQTQDIDFDVRAGQSRALARLLALARDPDGGDAGRRCDPACRGLCVRANAREARSERLRHPQLVPPEVAAIGTQRRPDARHAYAFHRCDRVRSTSASASSLPIGP